MPLKGIVATKRRRRHHKEPAHQVSLTFLDSSVSAVDNDAVLHAYLHHKLDESMPVSRRREDAVTSSVFGTLLLANAESELLKWLNQAVGPLATGAPIKGPLQGAWFWPRLTHVEPDLVLRFENRIVIVEAKVNSGLHGSDMDHNTDPADLTPISNQLVRQWECATAPNLGPMCPSDLASALRSHARTLTLIFLVDGQRMHHAQREFEKTVAQSSERDFRLLTWQSLHRNLAREAVPSSGISWRSVLIKYLEHAELTGYVGFQGVRLPAGTDIDAVRHFRWMAPEPTKPFTEGPIAGLPLRLGSRAGETDNSFRRKSA